MIYSSDSLLLLLTQVHLQYKCIWSSNHFRLQYSTLSNIAYSQRDIKHVYISELAVKSLLKLKSLLQILRICGWQLDTLFTSSSSFDYNYCITNSTVISMDVLKISWIICCPIITITMDQHLRSNNNFIRQ